MILVITAIIVETIFRRAAPNATPHTRGKAPGPAIPCGAILSSPARTYLGVGGGEVSWSGGTTPGAVFCLTVPSGLVEAPSPPQPGSVTIKAARTSVARQSEIIR